MEEAKEATRAGGSVKKKRRTTVDCYLDPKIIIQIPSEEGARLFREKHNEVLRKSVRLNAVFDWYTNRQGQNYPPAVLSALRQRSVTHHDEVIDMTPGEKEAEVEEQEAEEEQEEEEGAEEHMNENYSADAI